MAVSLLCLSVTAFTQLIGPMLKALALVVMTGAVVVATAIPVVGTADGTMAETRGMLLAATAFFGLAWAMRARSKGPRRGGPTRPA